MTRRCPRIRDPPYLDIKDAILKPLLGNVQSTVATDDDTFFRLLTSGKQYDAVVFGPGAIRWQAAKQPIPGYNSQTASWNLERYHAEVRKHLGDVPIVGTPEEFELIPLIKKALGV